MNIDKSKEFAKTMIEQDWYKNASKQDMEIALFQLMRQVIDDVQRDTTDRLIECRRAVDLEAVKIGRSN